MRLDIGIYAVLLVVGLGAAYWASLPVTEGDEEKVRIVSFDPKTIAEITLTTKGSGNGPEVQVKASRRADDDRYWIQHAKIEAAKAEAPKPETAAGEAAEAQADSSEPKITQETFLGNEKMDEFIRSFNPLVAVRVIGAVSEAQLEEFGLAQANDVLSVKTTDGKVLELVLGKKSYGTRHRFVLERGDLGQKRVLLIDDQGFENLERAPLRLYERRLYGFDLADVSKVTISAGSLSKVMAHTTRDKNGELLWTDDEENAPAKPSYDSWMDKVAKLRLTAYADAAQEEALAGVEPFLELSFERGGKALGTVRFKKLAGDKPTYWVTGDFLKTHAQVPNARMEQIEKDIATIIGDSAS